MFINVAAGRPNAANAEKEYFIIVPGGGGWRCGCGLGGCGSGGGFEGEEIRENVVHHLGEVGGYFADCLVGDELLDEVHAGFVIGEGEEKDVAFFFTGPDCPGEEVIDIAGGGLYAVALLLDFGDGHVVQEGVVIVLFALAFDIGDEEGKALGGLRFKGLT